MSSTARDDSYDHPRWGYRNRGAWGCWGGGGPYSNGSGPNGDDPRGPQAGPPPWAAGYPFRGPHFVPKPLLIVLTVLGFMWWWPVGLAFLAVTLCRKRMFCGYRRWGGWQNAAGGPGPAWKQWFGGAPPSSGNRAFDDYRAETLRRLEEEQKDFTEFLERLRFAKDKAEFDEFMNERRNRPTPPPASEPPAAPAS